MAARFQTLVAERQRRRDGGRASVSARRSIARARPRSCRRRRRATALGLGFASLFSFAIALLTWNARMGWLQSRASARGRASAWWRCSSSCSRSASSPTPGGGSWPVSTTTSRLARLRRRSRPAARRLNRRPEPVFLPLAPSGQEAVVTHAFRRALVLAVRRAWPPAAAPGRGSGPRRPARRSLVPAVFPRWDLGRQPGLLSIVDRPDTRQPWQALGSQGSSTAPTSAATGRRTSRPS